MIKLNNKLLYLLYHNNLFNLIKDLYMQTALVIILIIFFLIIVFFATQHKDKVQKIISSDIFIRGILFCIFYFLSMTVINYFFNKNNKNTPQEKSHLARSAARWQRAQNTHGHAPRADYLQ